MLESFEGFVLQAPYQTHRLWDAWTFLTVVSSVSKGSPASSPLPCTLFGQYRKKTKIWPCQERKTGDNNFKEICKRDYKADSRPCCIFYSLQIFMWDLMIPSQHLVFRYRIRTQTGDGRKKLRSLLQYLSFIWMQILILQHSFLWIFGSVAD